MLERDIEKAIAGLDSEERKRVVRYVSSLDAPAELPANWRENLLSLAGSIPTDVLDELEKAIDAGCERIDSDGW